MIFSHYDNQLRKERCVAGVKAALQNGVWCAHLPIGYSKIEENGETKIVVNETGKLLGKAFHWKANEGLSNEECRARLDKLGLKVNHQRMSVVFKNPFYCGLMAHNVLEGKLIEGKHEKLISKELFLKVNDIQNKNAHGYRQCPEQDNVPLKIFYKCEDCKTGYTGYVVKKKNIWYYKCRHKGCGSNKSAKELNKNFESILSYFTVSDTYKPLVKELLKERMLEENKEEQSNAAILKAQISEVDKKIERTEERYMAEEINQELYVKYATKYKQEKLDLMKELAKVNSDCSNLENEAEFATQIAENISKLWHSGEYKEKQRLQYYLFPNGIYYNRKTGTVRTNSYNSLFLWMCRQQQDVSQNKNGIPELNLSYAALVAGE
ncbi:MAG: recombinase family protein [Bacteroidia bacterium]